MQGFIHDFDVVKEKIHQRRNMLHCFRVGVAGSIKCGVQFFSFCLLEKSIQERLLHHRLTARKGDATARFFIKNPILLDFVHHLVNGHEMSCGFGVFEFHTPEHKVTNRFFTFNILTFGIVAPPARQRTTFEEQRCPDARSVVYRKPPDIEDKPFYHRAVVSL